MEFNMNDILTALQSGQDPQDIANSFADQLNAAIRQKAEDDKVADAKSEKIARAAEAIDVVLDLLEDFYPDLYTDEMRDAFTAEDLVEAMDEAYAEIQRMSPVLDALGDLLKELEKEETPKHTLKVNIKDKASLNNPIDMFLKANGLKS